MQLTQEGSITGSPLYMSPEQALGDSEPDARSDIYSLGAVAYYLLTGVPPFDGDKAIKIILAHAHQPVVPPSRLRSEIPADVERSCCAAWPRIRPSAIKTAAELRQAFADCVAAGGWTRDDAARWWQANGVRRTRTRSTWPPRRFSRASRPRGRLVTPVVGRWRPVSL